MVGKVRKGWKRFVVVRAHLVDPDRLFPVQAALLAPPSAALGATPYAQHDVSRFPIRTLVTLSLIDDFVTLGGTAGYVKRKVSGVFEHLVTAAGGALSDDDAASPAASVARYLRLRVHAREDLLFDHAHAATAAFGTRVDVTVRGGAGSAAVVA